MAIDFAAGGCAALLAITLVHPIDVVKSRMQFSGELGSSKQSLGVFGWLTRLFKEEGISSLYRGLSAAYGLQFSVTATRFGTYSAAKSLWGDNPRSDLQNIFLAGASGAAGAIAGNPFFAIKTRMQLYATSNTLRVGNYQYPNRGLLDSILAISREEGIKGYFRGLDAFLPRVVFYGAAQLASYDAMKSRLTGWKDGPKILREKGFIQHATCGVIAAFCSVTTIQPFDFIAVRMQNQPVDLKTKKGLFYSNPVDCFIKSVKTEGPFSVFKGYPANVIRFGPYTVLIFVFVEQFRELFKSFLQK